jgi:thiamine-phosphate pyrophosphorylase
VLEAQQLRLMVVTSGAFRGRSHDEVADAAIRGGATALQLRAPELDDDELLALATDLAARCREAGLLFVVNDRIEIAEASGADGAHVGQGDRLRDARAILGPGSALGISVTDAEQAHEAVALGADYLGVTVWATATKPEAMPGGLEGLRTVARATHLPVVGIGGIDATNASKVLRAGAAGVAVISAVADADDQGDATRELRRAVDEAIDGRGAP